MDVSKQYRLLWRDL